MLEIHLSQVTRLRDILLRTHSFDNLMAFRAFFADSRIARWRNRVPVASTPAACIDVLIATLCDLNNDYGENALILFLHVLSDNTAPDDPLHDELAQLIKELEAVNTSLVLTAPISSDSAGAPPPLSSGAGARPSATASSPSKEPPMALPSSEFVQPHVPSPAPLFKKKSLLVVWIILLVILIAVSGYVYIRLLSPTG